MPAARAVGAPSAVCVLHDQGNDEPLLPKLRHTAGYLVRGKTGEGRHLLRRRHPKAAALVELAAQRNHYRPAVPADPPIHHLGDQGCGYRRKAEWRVAGETA